MKEKDFHHYISAEKQLSQATETVKARVIEVAVQIWRALKDEGEELEEIDPSDLSEWCIRGEQVSVWDVDDCVIVSFESECLWDDEAVEKTINKAKDVLEESRKRDESLERAKDMRKLEDLKRKWGV